MAEKLIDPDCRDGKHENCPGGACECDCHAQPESPVEWNGVSGSTEHRTTKYRAWCFQDAEWCYPDAWCDCCHAASSHWQVWLPEKDSDEYVSLAVEIHLGINPESDRGPVLEVLDALWGRRE